MGYQKRVYIKKAWYRRLTPVNVAGGLLAIVVSFCTVSFCSAIQASASRSSTVDVIARSTIRIADAFDYYNKKRFVED